MLKIRLPATAENDLEKIWLYTLAEWGGNQAQQYISFIEQGLHLPLDNPHLGKLRPDIKEGYRALQVEKHLIFYLVSDMYIDVLAIPHICMDVKNHMISSVK